MQRQLSTKDKKPTNLLKYAERCQRVVQKLKDAAHIKTASEQYNKNGAAATIAPASNTPAAKKIATSSSTTAQTTSSIKPNH